MKGICAAGDIQYPIDQDRYAKSRNREDEKPKDAEKDDTRGIAEGMN